MACIDYIVTMFDIKIKMLTLRNFLWQKISFFLLFPTSSFQATTCSWYEDLKAPSPDLSSSLSSRYIIVGPSMDEQMTLTMKVIVLLSILSVVSRPAEGITGGTPAKASDFPFVVQLFIYKIPACTGAQVSKNMFVTSGRCIYRGDRPIAYKAAGKIDEIEDGKMINVKKIIFPDPPYDTKTTKNDIVLIQTVDPLPGTPIKLPKAGQDFTGKNGTMIGFGLQKVLGDESRRLHMMPITFMDGSKCADEYNKGPNQSTKVYDTETNNCAMDPSKKAFPCEADDGDPMIVKMGSDQVLAGLMSSGNDCGDYPGPFYGTEVSAYVKDFIMKNI